MGGDIGQQRLTVSPAEPKALRLVTQFHLLPEQTAPDSAEHSGHIRLQCYHLKHNSHWANLLIHIQESPTPPSPSPCRAAVTFPK